MPKLLIETFQMKPNTDLLKEWKDKVEAGEPLVVKALIQRADQKNQNGRIYPYEVLQKECDRYLNDIVKSGNAIGCLDHEDDPVIKLDKASHIMRDLWWDGPDKKEVWGAIEILPTPKGDIAKSLLLRGVPVGISSRAVGSVSKNEAKAADVVENDLNLICWDLVATPSTSAAFLKLHEAKEVKFNPRLDNLPKEIRIKQTLKELLGKK